MKLKPRHIIIGFVSLFLVSCAMENKNMNSKEADEIFVATEEADDIAEYEVTPTINSQLINQKLQDFYDLVALQNEHPEFIDEVSNQLKNFTNDSIDLFKTDDFAIVKNIRQLGKVMTINDSVQKIKLSYDKVTNNTTSRDTIYAIITKKTIILDDERLISNKVQFSKQ